MMFKVRGEGGRHKDTAGNPKVEQARPGDNWKHTQKQFRLIIVRKPENNVHEGQIRTSAMLTLSTETARHLCLRLALLLFGKSG